MRGRLLGAGLLTFASCLPVQADLLQPNLARIDLSAFPQGEYSRKQESDRLTLACQKCEGLVAIDVQIMTAPWGMEERIRSGKTTAATMLATCKKNAEVRGSQCFDLKPANVKKAVGFVSDVGLGPGVFSATYVIYQDGKLVQMRNVAGSRAEAKRLGRLAFKHIAPQIVR